MNEPLRVETVRGPLDDERLGWIAALYGRVDAKYRSNTYLRHLLEANPCGWSLHAFALDGARAVGHCCVVPLPARRARRELLSGKVEAYVVEEAYRARTTGPDDTLLAVELLRRLYEFADGNGIEVLHAFATPELGILHRMLGFRRLDVGERSLVRLTEPRAAGAIGGALYATQSALGEAIYAGARSAARVWRTPALRPLSDDDAVLAEAEPGDETAWTISGTDAWPWYAGSNLLGVLEIPGRAGSRALVRTADGSAEGFRILGWRPTRPGLLPALLLLGAASRLARRQRASALRFQPWHGRSGDGSLARAARVLGFVPRADFSTLYVRSADPELARAANVRLTPFFYTTF